MTDQRQLADAAVWISELRPQDVPDDVMVLARCQLVDTIGAICGGARSAVGKKVRRGMERTAAPGPCTVFPDGARWSVCDAVYLHSALANALELDNFVLSGHFGQSAVAVALALGESLGSTFDEVLTAQVVGLEVGTRLGAYISAGPHHGQMRAYAHRLAAASCAARLLGLAPEVAERALAIALAAPEFPMVPAAFSPDTKANMSSAPTVEGLRAAFLAEAGLDAATEILDHPLGLVGMFTYMDVLPRIWERLGQSWYIHSLSTKTQPTCAYAQGAVTAAVALHDEVDFSAGDVARVEVRVPMTAVVMEAFSKPHEGAGVTPVNTHFSTRRSVAAALHFGRLTSDFFDESFRERADAIQSLADRVEVRHDWGMTVDLIRGVDAGLEGAGRPGVYGMGQTHRTLDKFKKLVGSRALIGLRDIPDLLRLSAPDRTYLIRRFWQGYRARLPFRGGVGARTRYRSAEADMRRLEMRMAGHVTVFLKDGRSEARACRVPPGFAGDPHRLDRMRDKFLREAGATMGRKAEPLLRSLETLPGEAALASAFDCLPNRDAPC